MTLFEKYRPRTWSEVVGQDRAVRVLTSIRDRDGFGGRAVYLSGQSGTGKTTLALLVAGEIADPFNVTELDATDLTPARIDAIEAGSTMFGMGSKSGRAYIVNECHGLRSDAIRKLLVVLERIPPHVVWIFTTTVSGEEKLFDDMDASPLLSRCLKVSLAQRDLCKPFADVLVRAAVAEGLADNTPETIKRAETILKQERNNLRAGFQRVESGELLELAAQAA